MNITKIQQGMIAYFIKGEMNRGFNYGEAVIDEKKHIIVVQDDAICFLIDEKDFFIDLGKSPLVPLSIINKLLAEETNAEAATLTNEMRCVPKFKMNIVKIAKVGDKDDCAWIDEKWLKYFDKKCTFGVINEKAPVFIYEDEKLAGVCLPVHVKKESDNGS